MARISDGDANLLKHTFIEVFALRSAEEFGSDSMRLKGVSDGARGVQWNTSIDDQELSYLGVNLEGIEYEGWPISRFIQSELDRPGIFEARALVSQPEDVWVEVWRDEWPGPHLRVRIEPTPIKLSELDQKGWSEALSGALTCLDASRDFLGRAKFGDIYVSPHVQFWTPMWNPPMPMSSARSRAMLDARQILEPLHEFMRQQST